MQRQARSLYRCIYIDCIAKQNNMITSKSISKIITMVVIYHGDIWMHISWVICVLKYLKFG